MTTPAADTANRVHDMELRMERLEERQKEDRKDIAKITTIAEKTSGRINVLIVSVLVAAIAFAGNVLFFAINLGVHKP